jgi:uncharacterized protein
MDDPWYKDGLKFTCTQCGKCCTGEPGYVWLDDEEVTKIAAALGEKRNEFLAVFTQPARGKVTLREKLDGDCVLYSKERGCTVYRDRPKQCRTWPFWESNLKTPEDWERTERVCPGSGDGELIPVEEIVKRMKLIKM